MNIYLQSTGKNTKKYLNATTVFSRKLLLYLSDWLKDSRWYLQTEILSTFNNVRWAVFCGSSRLGSHKIYEPSRKSLSEWLTGLLWLYEIWAFMQHRVHHRQIDSVELKRRLIDIWSSLDKSTFDEAIDQWRGRHQACVHAKGRHFEYSLWVYNVDFVNICYIQSMWVVWLLHL